MKSMRLNYLILTVAMMAPLGLSAHPGHGGPDAVTVWHYLFTPDHMFPALGILCLAFLLFLKWATDRERKRTMQQ